MLKIKTIDDVTFMTSKDKRVSLAYHVTGKMVMVAVSYCSIHDKFSRQIGRDIVYDRIVFNENCITLPIGKFSEWAIQAILVDMFFEFE